MLYATFVVPAPNGCNLRCPGCAIAQRGEAKEYELSHKDYVNFLADVLTHFKVGRVGIQGYEPLLPEAWPLTRKLLKLAAACFAETSLITNGVYLPEHAGELARMLDSITVSLNSADAEIHDKTRGVNGAFAKALKGIRGIRSATGVFSEGSITVNSVLYPKKAHFLEGMAELLAEVGVRHWLISPFIQFKKGRPVSDAKFIRDTILHFSDHAEKLGVKVSLSDELGVLRENEDPFEKLSVEALEDAAGFFRLSPDASCSRGKEALEIASGAPKWDRVEKPNIFLERIFGEINRPLRKRKIRWLARVMLSIATR